MLTKFEMEKIWNDREIGILKRNFCSHKKVKKDGEVGVCSRNMNLREDASNAYWRAANACGLIRFLQERFEGNYAIQGELMGPGVQGNREGLKELKFFVFDQII